jgi:hypothetical protein
MGLGELGGDDSVQLFFHLPTPRGEETEYGDAVAVWDRARAKQQLSKKANSIAPKSGQIGFRGQDRQNDKDKTMLGDFVVTVNFANPAEVSAARAVFERAADAGASSVVFRLAVRYKTPGQIQIEWPD